MKGILVVEVKDRTPTGHDAAMVTGPLSLGMRGVVGALWLVLKVFFGWRFGKALDHAYFEQFGMVEYFYLGDSVRDHVVKYRPLRLLFSPTNWGISFLYALAGTGLFIACRLVSIHLVPGGPDQGAVGVGPAGVGAQLTLEGIVVGALCFSVPFAVFLWWSIRSDFVAQAVVERGSVPEGKFVKVVPAAQWDLFSKYNTAVTSR